LQDEEVGQDEEDLERQAEEEEEDMEGDVHAGRLGINREEGGYSGA
jgi:hypothetical protein